jgi:aspartate-semialdehyde dehydrogenase
MSLERESTRIVIAGASSLLGAELKSLLEQGRFALADFRLLDEELAAGTLTEAGGEAVVIQPVEEDSFKRARFVFFTGSQSFTEANLDLALRSGALVIDLSGHSASLAEAVPWFRGFDSLHGQLSAADTQSKLVSIPSAAAEAIVRIAFGLADLRLRALTATVLWPVSFQPAGTQLFDAQIAFNTMLQFGEKSRFDLHAAAATLRAEVNSCLRGSAVVPAIQLVHVPAFYGTTLSVCAELDPTADVDPVEAAIKAAGFTARATDDPPNNINVAEDTAISLARPARDEVVPGIWWFWGAADNIRLRAWNAVKLVEMLAEKLAE